MHDLLDKHLIFDILNSMRKITRNPRLLKRRNELILQLRGEGFFLHEIGEIFRLQKARIHQILKVAKDKKNNKK